MKLKTFHLHDRAPRKMWLTIFLIGFLLLVVGALPARAQALNEGPGIITRTFAITNTTVVVSPTKKLQNTTVIVRDGLIYAVGADLAIPFDADVIVGDSLMVYAGFIDGFSHIGVPKPKPNNDLEDPDHRGRPSNDRAGITPQVSVSETFSADEKDIKKWREAGFTAAHVSPYGRMFPGQNAIVLLAEGASADLIFAENTAMNAQFSGARGVYPSNLLGMMAKWRDLYHRGTQHRALTARYDVNPTGLPRPAFNPVMTAFSPVVSRKQPVIFSAEDVLTARRAMRLSNELGFKLILGNLKEGWDIAGRLASENIPVFVSLKLPKEVKEEETDSTDADSADAEINADGDMAVNAAEMAEDNPSPSRTSDYTATEAEVERLTAVQAEWRLKYESNAATLASAGVNFGFSTEGAKASDVFATIRRMMANGLSEEAALAALTTAPAGILGVSGSMGTVETGKMGNLVLTTGPVFDEDTKIAFVFVDGNKFELEIKEKAATPASAEAVSLAAGAWTYTISSPQGDVGGTVNIESDGSSLSGSITNDQSPEPSDLESVFVDENTLTFVFTVDGFGTMTATVEIDGDAFTGNLDVPGFGVLPMEGTKSSDPE